MTLAIALAALVVALASALISARQLSEAKKANAFPATVDLFREYRTADMVAARKLLFERLPDLDPAGGFRDMPEDVRLAAVKVSHYLDNLGVLVANDLVEPKLAAGFLGDSALGLWTLLGPFIVQEREFRSYAFQQYFENLAVTLEEARPAAVLGELKSWSGRRLPPSP